MGIPNATHGGPVHSDRRTATDVNTGGTSRARYAAEASDQSWLEEHPGERQCAATGYQDCTICGHRSHQSDASCSDCGSKSLQPARCDNVAVEGKATCGAHGGNFVPSPKHLAAMRRGVMTTGLNFNQIMLCDCKSFTQNCTRKFELQDSDGVERCVIEQELFDDLTAGFIEEYKLESIADLLMLQRLAMSMIKIQRGEKSLVKFGDLVERSQTQPNGIVNTWLEANPSNAIVAQLDGILKGWLKELAVSRASRASLELTNSRVDIVKLLSGNSDVKTIEIWEGDDDE